MTTKTGNKKNTAISNDGGADRPLLIGVSSRSLFDLDADSRVFQNRGLEAYRKRQRKLVNKPLGKGMAFTFVERMLALNEIEHTGDTAHNDENNPASTVTPVPLVEVAVLSHMDPDTGLRVMNSIRHYGLPIRMTVFTSGGSLSNYAKTLGIRLYLSMDEDAVREAVDNGVPAGHILPARITRHDDGAGEVRLAFDFDGVIGDDSSERVYQAGGLEAFNKHESRNAGHPISPGPLAPFVRSLTVIQRAEEKRLMADSGYERRLRISVITSRGNPADIRVMRTLESWGITLDSAFFMNGHDKRDVLSVLRPHLFFDDQLKHLDAVDCGVHIPFGELNKQ